MHFRFFNSTSVKKMFLSVSLKYYIFGILNFFFSFFIEPDLTFLEIYKSTLVISKPLSVLKTNENVRFLSWIG